MSVFTNGAASAAGDDPRSRQQIAAIREVDASSSRLAARHAHVVAGADEYLPTMATEEFLSCLSKAAITVAA